MVKQEIINESKTELNQLKKALALEKSIEKIHSLILGLKHSSPFNKVLLSIFQELQIFDANIQTAHFYKFDEPKSKNLTFWEINKNGDKPTVKEIQLPYQDDIWFNAIHKNQLNNEPFWQSPISLKGGETALFKHINQEKHTTESFQLYMSFATKSGLLVLSDSQIPFDERILQRFSQVYKEAYLHLLELRKSELLIKNAKIEASLENVRVKGMAMKDTSELQELVNEVSLHLKRYQIDINGGVFICINQEVGKDVPLWGSGGAADYVQKAVVPYLDNPIFLNLH